jgi:hypothetical protein
MHARIRALGFLIVGLIAASPASAQIVHSIQFGAGFFSPRGIDTRADGDVLTRDFLGAPVPAQPDLSDALLFEMKDFRTGQLFGEWNVAFGPHVEVGASVAFMRKSVPTVYADFVDQQGGEIDQRLRLQVVPISAIVRFLPFGRPGDVQPYVGAGISALRYRYSEVGRFLDADTLEVFDDRFTASGFAPGGLVLGGVRIPLGGDIYSLSIEGRYQFGVGDTGGADNGFLADKIDLSGGGINAAFQVRF